MKKSSILLSLLATILSSNFLLAGQPVSNEEQFYEESSLACEGKYVGADCQIEFIGGSIGFGFCVEVPNGGGELTCNIDLTQIPSCQNNALGTQGSIIVFAVLAAFLMLVRRRNIAQRVIRSPEDLQA